LRDAGTLDPLKVIKNADKYRLIQVVGIIPGLGRTFARWGESHSRPVVFARRKKLKDGAVVVRATPDVHVNPHFTALVAFAEGCPTAVGRGVCFTLDMIARHVSETIEGFGPEFP